MIDIARRHVCSAGAIWRALLAAAVGLIALLGIWPLGSEAGASHDIFDYDNRTYTYDNDASPAGELRPDASSARQRLSPDFSRSYVTQPPLRQLFEPVAPNSIPSPIGFAPGEGVSALVPNRLQHGSRHLIDEGVLPPWRGKTSPQQIQDALIPILENPTATFDNVLGGTAVRGFIGTVDGHTVAVQVFAEGPRAGQLATSVVPSANQLAKWGVTP